ncbi:MAG: DUF1467 family protein [Pseudomonadota bacterium]
MNWTGGIVVYVIIWWCVFFAMLPIGVKGVWEGDADGEADGVEPGAPQKPEVLKKMWWTTAASAVLWIIVYIVIEAGLLG